MRCKNHGRINDPGEYVSKLADHFVSQGGTLQKQEITSFDIKDAKCRGVQTVDGRIEADVYVLTTGAWSSEWKQELGVTVPMESERGYHIE